MTDTTTQWGVHVVSERDGLDYVQICRDHADAERFTTLFDPPTTTTVVTRQITTTTWSPR